MTEENTPNEVQTETPPVEDKNVLRQELSKQGKAYQSTIAERDARIAQLEQVETDRKTAALKEANDFTALEAELKKAADEKDAEIAELKQSALANKLDGLLRDKGVTDEFARAGMVGTYTGDQDAWLSDLTSKGVFETKPTGISMPAGSPVAQAGTSQATEQQLWESYQKSSGAAATEISKKILSMAENGTASTWLLDKMSGSHTK